jgi:hypothetical protein
MLQASADWGKTAAARRWPLLAAARTGGRTARRRSVGNFSRRRGLLVPLPLSCSRVWNLPRPRSLPPTLPLTGVQSKASRLLWRRACSTLAPKRRLSVD